MSKTVEFSARVDEAEVERFKGMFPQYGSATWFITTALKAFNDQAAKNPTMQDMVDIAIESMVEENRKKADLTRELTAALAVQEGDSE